MDGGVFAEVVVSLDQLDDVLVDQLSQVFVLEHEQSGVELDSFLSLPESLLRENDQTLQALFAVQEGHLPRVCLQQR